MVLKNRMNIQKKEAVLTDHSKIAYLFKTNTIYLTSKIKIQT